jgi:hypothetical protein
MPKDLSEHSRKAMPIARQIIGDNPADTGEIMMMLETVTTATLMFVMGGDPVKAQGMLDSLQYGVQQRLMRAEKEKPRG